MLALFSYWWLAIRFAVSNCWSWLWANILLGVLITVVIAIVTATAGPWLGGKFPALKPYLGEPMDSFSTFAANAIGPAIILVLCCVAVFLVYLVFVAPAQIHSEQLTALNDARAELKSAMGAIKERDKIIEAKRPHLLGEIVAYGVGPRAEVRPGDTPVFCFLYLRIRNLGEPSIAERMSAQFTLRSGHTIGAKKIVIPEDDPIRLPALSRPIRAQDLIYSKMSKPIARGDIISGYVLLGLDEVNGKELEQNGGGLAVSFFDVEGNLTVCAANMVMDPSNRIKPNMMFEGEL